MHPEFTLGISLTNQTPLFHSWAYIYSNCDYLGLEKMYKINNLDLLMNSVI